MIESLEVQTYTNWELCIANASPEDAAMSEVLREYTSKDARVKVENLKENLGNRGKYECSDGDGSRRIYRSA